jgi:REP element-mobilizing transposase RayT
MTLFKDKYRVETTRLAGWDYRSAGYYFVTICTHDRACYLGEIRDGTMLLSHQGEIVAEEWRQTGILRGNVILDEWVIMPNHFHAIIAITADFAPCLDVKPPLVCLGVTGLKSGSLGAIINQFKSVCTKQIRAAGHDFGWQARYYEQIIRDEKSLHGIREYIVNNPLKWETDKDHSDEQRKLQFTSPHKQPGRHLPPLPGNLNIPVVSAET